MILRLIFTKWTILLEWMWFRHAYADDLRCKRKKVNFFNKIGCLNKIKPRRIIGNYHEKVSRYENTFIVPLVKYLYVMATKECTERMQYRYPTTSY